MATIKVFTNSVDVPRTMDITQYLVTVTKNNQFVQAQLYSGYSGHAMQDIVPDIRRQFPVSDGYRVEW